MCGPTGVQVATRPTSPAASSSRHSVGVRANGAFTRPSLGRGASWSVAALPAGSVRALGFMSASVVPACSVEQWPRTPGRWTVVSDERGPRTKVDPGGAPGPCPPRGRTGCLESPGHECRVTKEMGMATLEPHDDVLTTGSTTGAGPPPEGGAASFL